MSDEEDELTRRKAFESEGQYALRAAQELSARMEQHSREVNQKFDVVAEHLATLAVGQQQLQETQRRAEEKWARTEESIRSLLAIAQLHDQEMKATDERLNVLINTFERYIGGRNEQA